MGLKGSRSKQDDYLTSIDVSFSDLNGVAKMLHPASFRRLKFRLVEIYPDLTSGYGHARRGGHNQTEKGYISFENIYEYFEYDNKRFEEEIDKFLGIKK